MQQNLEIDNKPLQDILSKNETTKFKIKTNRVQKRRNNSFLGKKSKLERKKNSLEEIAQKFIKYISKLKNDKIYIKNVVKALNIKQRRIYDITNVLEGRYIYYLILFFINFNNYRYWLY